MSITFPDKNFSLNGSTDITSITQAITAAAGDYISFGMLYWENADWNDPVWNGITLVPAEVSPLVIYGSSLKVKEWVCFVPSGKGGTFNLTVDTVGGVYSAATHKFEVLDSSISAFPSVPIKSYHVNIYDTVTGPFNLSMSENLTANDVMVVSIYTFSTDTGYVPVTTDFTNNGTSLNAALNSNKGMRHVKSFYKTGTGVITGTFTRTVPGDTPMMVMTTMVFGEAAQLVTSINGGAAIKPGQTGVPIVTTGFTVKPNLAVGTWTGGTIAATVGAGTANSFAIDVQDRVSGSPWPTKDTVIAWTFSNSVPESAVGTQTITVKTSEVAVTFIDAVTTDAAFIGYHLNFDGLVVEGGEFTYLPYDDLVVFTDSNWEVTSLNYFDSWFRPAGTSSNIYYYRFTISASGISVAAKGKLLLGVGISV